MCKCKCKLVRVNQYLVFAVTFMSVWESGHTLVVPAPNILYVLWSIISSFPPLMTMDRTVRWNCAQTGYMKPKLQTTIGQPNLVGICQFSLWVPKLSAETSTCAQEGLFQRTGMTRPHPELCGDAEIDVWPSKFFLQSCKRLASWMGCWLDMYSRPFNLIIR